MTTNPPPKPNTPPAVAALYIHGRSTLDNWPDYISEYNLTAEHISTLIDIITDETHLFWVEGEFAADVVVHAYRALGQLHALEAIPALVSIFKYEDGDILGDFFTEDLPPAIYMMGEPALPYLRKLLPQTKNDWSCQISVLGNELGCLKLILSTNV